MGTFRRIKAALIGSGAISEKYLTNITKKFHVIDMVGCSDIIPERSAQRAEQFGIRQMTNEEILSDPTIEIVVNTTYPLSHYEVTKAALLAGKHVYTEKMLAVTLEEGLELCELAKEKGLMLTTAPDTFLGGGWQTARHMIDTGLIGTPIGALGVCIRSYQDHGDTYTEPKGFIFGGGGGIPFDMGGYYLHNMINLLGGIRRVTGFIQARNEVRPYTNPRHPKFGESWKIDSPNTMFGTLEFCSGALGSLVVTSESSLFDTPKFEVYGTQGTLRLFDPNDYSGKITLQRNVDPEPVEMPLLFPYNDENRGIGVADMAYAMINGRKPRDSFEIGLQAFEAVHGIWKSGQEGIVYEMKSTCERPKAVPLTALAGDAYESQLND